MAMTFGKVWRQVLLRCPDAPSMLCQDWVMTAYRTLCDRRGWSFLNKPGQLVYEDSRDDLAVVVAQGSTVVTSAGLFLPADEGRQFRVGTFPIYTVDSYVDANTIGLSEPYRGTGGGAVTAQIVDAWVEVSEDFGRFITVVNTDIQRQVPWWMTQDELNVLDPTRQAADTNPRLLCGIGPSTQLLTLGQAQYAYWPIPTEAGALAYYYVARPAQLTDDDPLIGVLAARPDILVTGALSEAALWPGTKDRPNAYFNIATRQLLRKQFEDELLKLDLRDDDQVQQSWSTQRTEWINWAWAYNTRLLQMTDATIGDYAGMGGYGW